MSARSERCQRDGCLKPAGRTGWCSSICLLVDRELDKTQRVCTAVSDAGELWSAAVGLSDALTEYLATQQRLRRKALADGMSSADVRELLYGPRRRK